MDQAIASYSAFSLALVAAVQRLGLLSIPVAIAITVIVNLLGGEKAIRVVGIAILVVGILNIILASALGLGTWIGGLSSITATPAPPSGH